MLEQIYPNVILEYKPRRNREVQLPDPASIGIGHYNRFFVGFS
jgi:hypothetical protein